MTIWKKAVTIVVYLIVNCTCNVRGFIYPTHFTFNRNHDFCNGKLRTNSLDAIDDDSLDSFTPKFDNQLIFGLEVDDEGKLETTLKDIQKNTGINDSNLKEKNIKSKSTTNTNLNLIQSNFEATSTEEYVRERSRIKKVPVISRRVPLGIFPSSSSSSELASIIWEMEKPSDLVENWMTASPAQKDGVIRDPFGVVMWPGSILASQEMNKLGLTGKTVLVLGAGTGVEAQAAAMLGAKKVIATDVNRFTMRLLNFGAERMKLDHIIESREFDIFSSDPLPDSDVVVAADILYNEQLAKEVARRCCEILDLPIEKRPQLIVTDSQKFHGTNFLDQLKGDYPDLRWEDRILHNVTGSGILIEEDQTYDVKARILII